MTINSKVDYEQAQLAFDRWKERHHSGASSSARMDPTSPIRTIGSQTEDSDGEFALIAEAPISQAKSSKP